MDSSRGGLASFLKNGLYRPIWLPVVFFATALFLGLPGHLTVDSLIQMYEGQSGTSISFNPPFMSVLLSWLGGSAQVSSSLFVVLMAAFYALATYLLIKNNKRIQSKWLILLAIFALGPVVLIYSGIVWKDVLMAHSVALMMALTLSLGRIKSLSLPKAVIAYGFCLLGLVFILGSRQQGILFVLVIALCFSLVITKPLFLRLLVCLSLVGGAWVINGQIAQGLDKGDMPDGSRVGLTIAMRYDLAGILANGGELNSDNTTLLNELGNDATMYSPSRVDTLTGPASQVWSLPFSDFKQIWWGAVTANPGAYIKHRLSHYLELLYLGSGGRCLPYTVGVMPFFHPEKQLDLNAELGVPASEGRVPLLVKGLAKVTMLTPLYSHWFYLLGLLALFVYFLVKKQVVAAAFAFSGVAFSGSFLIFSIACDFRYMYTSVVVCNILAMYLVSSRHLSSAPASDNA